MSTASPACGDGSSAALPSPSSEENKPLIVRVKRKPSHSPLDAFWLEVNERPLKRPLLDFQNLSISDSSGTTKELRTKKVFVKHVETTSSSNAASELLQSLLPRYSEESTSKLKIAERRSTFKKEMIKEELLSKAREANKVSAKNARFEQIWRSRNRSQVVKNDEALHEMCYFYDVVRVDGEEKSSEVEKEEDLSVEDQRLLSSYLPLLRDFIPSAAAEIESDLSSNVPKQGSTDYVYDYYVVHDGPEICEEDVSTAYPLVQVDEEEDFYDGPDSEWESDDSNAENNPIFDYPDETSEEEEETESEESDSDSDEEEGLEDASDESADMSGDASSEHLDPFSDFEDDFGYYDDDEGGFYEDGNGNDN